MPWSGHDIGDDNLTLALHEVPLPSLLGELVALSRRRFGWFSRTPARVFEYPWVVLEAGMCQGKRMLDVGAGVSPLPLALAQRGARVTTVDSSRLRRRHGEDEASWNEWGFLDYSELSDRIDSVNESVLETDLRHEEYDCIYSVSVVEHMPASDRRRLWVRVGEWIRPGGALLLTVDLAPGTNQLWRFNLEEEVESVDEHGDVDSLQAELAREGFKLERRETVRDLRDSKTDCILLRFVKSTEGERGHLRRKYSPEYFLGGVDRLSGSPFGVLGHDEFRAGILHHRHQQELIFTSEFAGGLEGRHVLEIGFGRGDLIPGFLEAGVARYTGMDFSPSAAAIATTFCSDPRVRLFELDATQLHDESAFDIVVLLDTIEHIPPYEMEEVWPRIHRSLRPSGRVIVSTPVYDNPNACDHSDVIDAESGMHCNKQTVRSLARSCLRHGFTIARYEDERLFGLVRQEDLALFDVTTRASYAATQASLLEAAAIGADMLAPSSSGNGGLRPDAGRVAVGCVAENEPKYVSQALRLLQSLRWFGGRMAGANFFVCVLDEADPEFVAEFERHGAFVRIVPRLTTLHPPSNKLRFLELPEIRAYDTVLLLDCDTLVVADPWPFLDGNVLQAKLADVPIIPRQTFRRLFEHFSLPEPKEDYLCNPSGVPTIWYCNAGALVIPQRFLEDLARAWLGINAELLKHLELLGRDRYYCDQASLALAFAAAPVPFRELPLGMNYPMHHEDTNVRCASYECEPVVLHYHDRVDGDGCLLPSLSPRVQEGIEAFNRRVMASERTIRRLRQFDNSVFWDARYSQNPAVGSGVGSRGLTLVYKRELLRNAIDELLPRSILDVGCGDLAVSHIVPEREYTGVDVSPVVVERNRHAFPTRRFVCADILELDNLESDVIVCLDLLIHVDDVDRYRGIVERLVRWAGRGGVVSGYETKPKSPSVSTFFFEALSSTLRSAGAHRLRRLGQYRDVTVWLFERAQESFPPRHADGAQLATRARGAPAYVIGCESGGAERLADLLSATSECADRPLGLTGDSGGRARNVARPGGGPGQADGWRLEETSGDLATLLADARPGWCRDGVVAALPPAHVVVRCIADDGSVGLPEVAAEVSTGAKFIWVFYDLPDAVGGPAARCPSSRGTMRTGHDGTDPVSEGPGGESRARDEGHVAEPWAGEAEVTRRARHWLVSNLAISHFVQALPAGRCHVVPFPELVACRDATVTRCLAFLGRPLPSFVKRATSRPSELERPMHQLSFEDAGALVRFVDENARTIDSLIKGKKPSAEYRCQLELLRSGEWQTRGARLHRAPEIWCESGLEDGASLLIGDETAVRINVTGKAIWDLCDGVRSLEDVVGELARVFDGVCTDELRTEAESFVSQLVAARCIYLY